MSISVNHGHKKAADWQPKDEKPIGGVAGIAHRTQCQALRFSGGDREAKSAVSIILSHSQKSNQQKDDFVKWHIRLT